MANSEGRSFVSRSRQDFRGRVKIALGEITKYLRRSKGTLAALGANQATAALISKEITQVTASDGAKGVRLPVPIGGEELVVINTVAAQALLIYPAVGGIINYAAANAAYSLAGQKHVRLISYSAGQWYAILGA